MAIPSVCPMRTLYDAFADACRRVPDHPFLAASALSGGRLWTYAQALHETDALANAYRAAGWGAGHRVALGVGNHPRHFLHFLALNRLGASIVPLNPDHRSAELKHALGHARVGLAVCHGDRIGAVRQAVADEPTLAALPSTSCSGRPPHWCSGQPVAFSRAAQQEMESSASPGGAPRCSKTEREVLKPAECCGQASSCARPSWRPVSAGSTSSAG